MRDERLLGESPAKDLARERGFTDRTSLRAFRIEANLKAHDPVVRRFLFLTPEQIERALYIRWRLGDGGQRGVIPLSDKQSVYGYFAGSGCGLSPWTHAPAGFLQLDEFPRLLVETNLHEGDFPLNEVVSASSPWVEDTAPIRFTYRPLRLLAWLTPSGQVEWDWSDIDALGETSFRFRLMAIQHSIRCLLGSEQSIIPRILAFIHATQR